MYCRTLWSSECTVGTLIQRVCCREDFRLVGRLGFALMDLTSGLNLWFELLVWTYGLNFWFELMVWTSGLNFWFNFLVIWFLRWDMMIYSVSDFFDSAFVFWVPFYSCHNSFWLSQLWPVCNFNCLWTCCGRWLSCLKVFQFLLFSVFDVWFSYHNLFFILFLKGFWFSSLLSWEMILCFEFFNRVWLLLVYGETFSF